MQLKAMIVLFWTIFFSKSFFRFLSFLFFRVTADSKLGELIVLQVKCCEFAEPTDGLNRQNAFSSGKARAGRRTRDLLSALA
jgi:hypothetical protein